MLMQRDNEITTYYSLWFGCVNFITFSKSPHCRLVIIEIDGGNSKHSSYYYTFTVSRKSYRQIPKIKKRFRRTVFCRQTHMAPNLIFGLLVLCASLCTATGSELGVSTKPDWLVESLLLPDTNVVGRITSFGYVMH